MIWDNARIIKTFIGIEDHGIFAWSIVFEGSSWGQGTGTRTFDADIIKEIVTKFGQWEDLQGKLVRVGRKHPGSTLVVMRDILNDKIEVVFDKEISDD